MKNDLEKMPQFYKDNYERDALDLKLKLFGSKRAIQSMFYFVHGELILDVYDSRLNSNNYLDLTNKRTKPQANQLFDEYMDILIETDFDEDIIHRQFRSEIMIFASKYCLDNKVKVKKKEKKTN